MMAQKTQENNFLTFFVSLPKHKGEGINDGETQAS
jgi:hypothetical protein